ncbi:MAG: NAD(P)H-dependent oxidoreductase [Planctomycetota bacterium]|jgi:multimeric flavodoxin WrbA|nr:NAD(P)H-dependent oxidoreductase [Planctomycetota bacterium]
MKTLFAYYSHEGNCRALAEAMAAAIPESGIEELARARYTRSIPKRGIMKYFCGGHEAMLKRMPKISPLTANPAAYDMIVVGWPVWFLQVAPPARTFMAGVDWSGKCAALFNMHRGGKGGSLREMARFIADRGGIVVGSDSFVDLRRGNGGKTKARAVEWAVECVEKARKLRSQTAGESAS